MATTTIAELQTPFELHDLEYQALQLFAAAQPVYERLWAAVAAENRRRLQTLRRVMRQQKLGICQRCRQVRPLDQLQLLLGASNQYGRSVLSVCTACRNNRLKSRVQYPEVYREGGRLFYRIDGGAPQLVPNREKPNFSLYTPQMVVTQAMAKRFGTKPSLRVPYGARLPKIKPVIEAAG